MTKPQRIIDAQVHAWAPETPELPWRFNHGDESKNAQSRAHFSHEIFTNERVVAEMDAAGVDAALFFNPGLYQGDLTYALETVNTYPGRFAIVSQVDPTVPDVAAVLSEWCAIPSFVGIRVTALTDAGFARIRDGALRPVFDIARQHQLPVNIYAPAYAEPLRQIVEEHPDVQFVIDHLGLVQPPVLKVLETTDPFGNLDKVLRLAAYPNVAIKATAVPSLSRKPFPFPDVWPSLQRVIDAFSVDRVLWGTDFTRVYELLSYKEGVDYLDSEVLSDSDKEALMGGTLQRIYGWPSS